MDRAAAIRTRLETALAPETLAITDESHLHAGHPGAAAGGGHFAVDIVAAGFRGLSLLERHRMIYDALSDLMPAEIHALSIRATTPEEQ
jgi:BolA protein